VKSFEVIFTRLAEQHVNELHAYISEHSNEERAYNYVGRIVECCKTLATFPQRGTKRDDVLPGLRVIGFERRVSIAFLVTADTVLIEGIFYGGRDFRANLLGRSAAAN